MITSFLKLKKSILSKEQKKIYKIMENTFESMYITGKAGSGKSFLLKYFVNNTKKKIAVVAPTGVAALNVGGQTIHSLFKLKPSVQNPEDIYKMNSETREVLKRIDTLIIDEISMVRVDLFEMINKKLQFANKNKLPFGGKQIIMFGDLYQIPPVVSDSQISRYLEDIYKGIFFFNAPSFKDNFKCYELLKIFRQKDPKFIKILNRIRTNNFTIKDLEKLNKRYAPSIEKEGMLTLVTTNRRASEINKEKLNKISKKEYSYYASINGEITKSEYPTDSVLNLKVGAQVIMLKNDKLDIEGMRSKKRWVNGTLATISYLNKNIIKVLINGVEHTLDKDSWGKYKYYYDSNNKKLSKKRIGEFIQYPIKLAWAITIHKAQGQTYENIMIDLTGGAFVSGQVYVAISRCIDLNNLYLKRKLSSKDIIISQEVINFMEDIKN